MSRYRVLALILVSSLPFACGRGALAPLPPRGASQLFASGAGVSRMEVTLDGQRLSSAQQKLLRRHETAAVLRQTALDWLDARGHFDPEGEVALRVQIRDLRVRSQLTALLLGGAAGSDHIEVSVVVLRGGEAVDDFAARVVSAAGGRDWKRPGDRLERMARMLGQRVAEAL